MRVLMFKPELAVKIEAGLKFQTIRSRANCASGDTLSLRKWAGKPYRSRQILITNTTCTRVDYVVIDGHGIVVGGKALDPGPAAVFAAADGFDSEDEMIGFFAREYGLPFSGSVIYWGVESKGSEK